MFSPVFVCLFVVCLPVWSVGLFVCMSVRFSVFVIYMLSVQFDFATPVRLSITLTVNNLGNQYLALKTKQRVFLIF